MVADKFYVVNNGTMPINQLVKGLKSIDPELRKSFIRNLKSLAKPVDTAIKQQLPQVSPLSGMNNNGRLGWGVGKPPTSTSVLFKSTGSKSNAVTPLLSVRVNSAASSVVDMAGRKSSGSTRSGKAMISKLNSIRAASRYVYPGGESARDQVIKQIEDCIEETSKIVMREFA
jgi:hypothetical protein